MFIHTHTRTHVVPADGVCAVGQRECVQVWTGEGLFALEWYSQVQMRLSSSVTLSVLLNDLQLHADLHTRGNVADTHTKHDKITCTIGNMFIFRAI